MLFWRTIWCNFPLTWKHRKNFGCTKNDDEGGGGRGGKALSTKLGPILCVHNERHLMESCQTPLLCQLTSVDIHSNGGSNCRCASSLSTGNSDGTAAPPLPEAVLLELAGIYVRQLQTLGNGHHPSQEHHQESNVQSSSTMGLTCLLRWFCTHKRGPQNCRQWSDGVSIRTDLCQPLVLAAFFLREKWERAASANKIGKP